MFVGGWPALTMGASAWLAGSARNGVPATELAPVPLRTGAGLCDERIPMATNTTRMSTARPRTTMAGRMEIPPGVGGRRGAAGTVSSGTASVSASVPCSVMSGPAYGEVDHPKWSRGPCPEPKCQSAPPARARAT